MSPDRPVHLTNEELYDAMLPGGRHRSGSWSPTHRGAQHLDRGQSVRIERHWWNGDRTTRGRRDVYIRTDGDSWEVEARAGGGPGRSKIFQCPGPTPAESLA